MTTINIDNMTTSEISDLYDAENAAREQRNNESSANAWGPDTTTDEITDEITD